MLYVSRTILLCEYVWTIIDTIKYYYTNETHLDLTTHWTIVIQRQHTQYSIGESIFNF